MKIYITILYKNMKSTWNDSHNLSLNVYVQSIIYWEFYHGIVDIANEEY